jgi:hypothetical protein
MQVQDLPPEIFHKVFSYLAAKDLVLHVSRVCVSWKAFSTDEILWKYNCLTRWKSLTVGESKLTLGSTSSWLSVYKSKLNKKNLSFLVLGAEGGGSKNERLLDVQKKLKSAGIKNVDIMNVRADMPALEALTKYSAILFFSYHGFRQAEVGDLLADYVDYGGGVVICTYANCGRGNRLEGKWEKRSLDPLQGDTSREANLKMGKVLNPKHPILKGVNSFNGGQQSSHGYTASFKKPNAQTVAEWSNGHPLVVTLPDCHVAALNFYPPSSDVASGGWDPKTQGGLLLANSLTYVATIVD